MSAPVEDVDFDAAVAESVQRWGDLLTRLSQPVKGMTGS
jgi:hypothetical protein